MVAPFSKFYSKVWVQKPMLRQKEWCAKNKPITKNGVLPITTLFFENSVSVLEPLMELI